MDIDQMRRRVDQDGWPRSAPRAEYVAQVGRRRQRNKHRAIVGGVVAAVVLAIGLPVGLSAGGSGAAPSSQVAASDPTEADPTPTIRTLTSDLQDEDGLVTVSLGDGTAPTTLELGRAAVTPVWSPDGRRFAFSGTADQAGFQGRRIFVVDADGTDLRQVTDNEAGYDLGPAWSPDGERIVFVRSLQLPSDPTRPVTRNVIVDVGSGAETVLTQDAGAALWSPDGRTILVSRVDSVVAIDVETGNERPLLRGAEPLARAWSVDGSHVLFTRRHPQLGCDVDWMVMRADGTDVMLLQEYQSSGGNQFREVTPGTQEVAVAPGGQNSFLAPQFGAATDHELVDRWSSADGVGVRLFYVGPPTFEAQPPGGLSLEELPPEMRSKFEVDC